MRVCLRTCVSVLVYYSCETRLSLFCAMHIFVSDIHVRNSDVIQILLQCFAHSDLKPLTISSAERSGTRVTRMTRRHSSWPRPPIACPFAPCCLAMRARGLRYVFACVCGCLCMLLRSPRVCQFVAARLHVVLLGHGLRYIIFGGLFECACARTLFRLHLYFPGSLRMLFARGACFLCGCECGSSYA